MRLALGVIRLASSLVFGLLGAGGGSVAPTPSPGTLDLTDPDNLLIALILMEEV